MRAAIRSSFEMESKSAKPKSKRRRGAGEGSIYQRADGRWVAQLFLGVDARGRRQYWRAYRKTRAEVASALNKAIQERSSGVLAGASGNDAFRTVARTRKTHRTAELPSALSVFARSGGLCGICGKPIDPEARFPSRDRMSIDHILPFSRGGTNQRGNLRAAHLRCNLERGNRDDVSADDG